MQSNKHAAWLRALALGVATVVAGAPLQASASAEDPVRAQVQTAMKQLQAMPALVAAREDHPLGKQDKIDARAKSSIDKGAKGTPMQAQKLDEPGGSVTLGVNPALACPGFYVFTIGDGPEAGIQPGSYGAELLLLAPGSRVLAGGLNFGGQMDLSAPGYAAFTIANAANENQRVDINLTGFRATAGSPNIRLRVTLERRLPSVLTVIAQTVTVGANSPYVTSAVVSPGFYVATVEPLDFLNGADGIFGMSMLSNYVNRPGGGFQGGVVVGGYHDPVVSATSGFAGFCLADAHTVQMRTEGRPTRGAAGAGDMRIVVADSMGAVVYANPVSPPSSDDHGNSCTTATPVAINSTLSGVVLPTSDVDFFRFTLSGTTSITAQASSAFDSVGTLYDGNCNYITEDDDGAGNLDFRLLRTLTAGTYYLRVASFQGASGGNYTVALSGVASGDDHGNSCATATSVSLNSNLTGVISPTSDVDYFRFTLGSTTLVTAQASTAFDSVGTLYDGACSFIAEDDDGAGNLDFRLQRTLSAGTYYLRVASFNSGSGGSYSIALSGSSASTVTATLRINNYLIYPVIIRANGVYLGNAGREGITSFTYSGPTSISVSWELIRPTIVGTSTAIGDTMSASYTTFNISQGAVETFTVDNVIGSSSYFAPQIDNLTSATLLMGVNVGLTAQNLCNCTVSGYAQNIALGYYRLYSNSNVRGYRWNSGYTGPYIYWGYDAAGSTTPLASLAQSGSGLVELTANFAP